MPTKSEQKESFLEGIRAGLSVTAAATDAGLNRTYVYRLSRKDPTFASAWAAAEQHRSDLEEKFGIYDVAFRPDGEEIAVATEGDLLIFDRTLRPLWSRSESWSHMEWLDSGTLLGTSSPNWSNFLLDPRRGLPTLELLREGQEEPIDSLVLDDYPGALALDREAGRVVLTLGDRMVVVRIDS